MAMNPSTKELLVYLQKNPGLRAQIRARPDKTLLYAGDFFKEIWQELSDLKRTNANFADKEILPDVLARIHCLGQPFPDLLAWANHLTHLLPKNERFIVWRALSGIFAANAVGAVSFYIGSNVSNESTDKHDKKVFAVTEISVLARNPNIDGVTRDILAYYQRCIQTKQTSMNFGFIAG